VPGPHFATISQAAGPKHRSLSELEQAGVATVSFPSVALFAAAHAVRHVAASLKRQNSLAEVGDALMSLPDYYGLVGLQAMMEREESCDRAAALLVV
jgi:2,3-dimethylmalate lyase